MVTVSPTYAHEIQTKRYGMELEGVLQDRSPDLYGVLNGIDDEVWDPSSDPYLPARYSVDEPAGKATCKLLISSSIRSDSTDAHSDSPHKSPGPPHRSLRESARSSDNPGAK